MDFITLIIYLAFVPRWKKKNKPHDVVKKNAHYFLDGTDMTAIFLLLCCVRTVAYKCSFVSSLPLEPGTGRHVNPEQMTRDAFPLLSFGSV